MENQKIIWTVLPNNYGAADKVRLSVFVSPRLSSNQANPRLDLFEDFLDWPKALEGVEFALQFGNNAPVTATRVGQTPDSNLWKALFAKDGSVFSYEFPSVQGKTIRSYAAKKVEGWIKSQFQSIVAESPIEHPTSTELATQLEPIMFYLKVEKEARKPAVVTRSKMVRDLDLASAPVQMNRVKIKDRAVAEAVGGQTGRERSARGVGGDREGRTRLQTGNIHPQLDEVLGDVNESVYTTAMLDLQHLSQEPTMEFKGTTLNALTSLYSELSVKGYVDNSGPVEPTKDFLQISFFHRPKQPHIIAIPTPSFDFHEACASLSNYPELMRKLGLVIDLEVPASAVQGDRVRLLPIDSGKAPSVANLWKGSDPTQNVRPTTLFNHVPGNQSFVARPKNGSEIVDGMLDLSDDQYGLTNLDIDGAAMKMMALAGTLRHYAAPDLRPERIAGIDTVASSAIANPNDFASKGVVVESATLPALRTAGISLIKTNQALRLKATLTRAAALNADAQPGDDDNILLYADDLVKGYRVDIWDSDSGNWHSLCKRSGEYEYERLGQTETIVDEGWIEIGAASAADQNIEELQKSWYVPETITTWNGWSKVAPQPGKKIIQPEDPADDDTWNADPNTSGTDYGLATNFSVVPGTLPKLRYGTTYRMRMRVADLAGNGLALEEAPTGTTAASEEILYTRFEPVPAPFLVPKTGIKAGESVEHMVVRSNYNMSAADYANLFGLPEFAAYPSERHVVPSRQAQRPAEETGRFDDPNTGRPQPSAYPVITGNDAFFPPFDSKQATKAVRPEQNLGVPWLPDIALGTTFRGLPGMSAGQILKRSYGELGNWPEYNPFILRLIEGESVAPTAPQNEGGIEVTTVALPKASLVNARFSSYIDPDALPTMAIWDWLSGASPVTQQKAADGLMWSITPFRGLTLIHVVQQPLAEPSFETLKASKKLGDTFAMLSGKIAVDGKSSTKLDVYAEWDEPIDNLALPGPKTLKKKNVAFQEGIDFDDEDFEFPPPPAKKTPEALSKKMKGKGALGVVGAAKSLTSYKVQQTPELAQHMTATSSYRKKSANVSKVAASTKSKMTFGITELADKPDERIRHDFGDTKYRRVRYRGVATSRFREYFLDMLPEETPTYDTLDDQRAAEADSANRLLTRTGEGTEIDILNSARPAAPKVRYVIPTFEFVKEEGPEGKTSKRISGLRVWMERPWYSSGDLEMLGVVIWPSTGPKKDASSGGSSPKGKTGPKAFKTDMKASPSKSKVGMAAGSLTAGESIPDHLVPYVTQWGADPIWMAGRLGSLPKVPDFLNPDATDSGLSMAEFPSRKANEFVSVAAYDVGYDEDRRLWYCDIEVNPHEAYFPFLRLALARYHPKSVVNAHLSRIVTADFIQVTPDRSVTVTFDDADPRLVRVAVTGVSYRASAAGQFGSEVEVTVETATGPEGDLEWIPAEGTHTVGIDRIGGIGRKLWDGLWAGEVELPEDRGTQPMRLVIREFEVLLGDGTELPKNFDIDGATAHEIAVGKKPELRKRLVYADVVEV